MSASLLFALMVNIAVGAWFIWGYPRTVSRSFPGRPPPPAFALLARFLPVVGVVIIVGSVLYGLLALLQ